MMNSNASNGVMNMLHFLIEEANYRNLAKTTSINSMRLCAIIVHVSESSNILLSVPAMQKAVFAPLSSETIWNDWPVRYPDQTTQ